MKIKAIPAIALGVALASPCILPSAIAADHEESATSDTSKNPLTGTVTETKEYKSKHKNADGSAAKQHVKKQTKTKTDGSVQKSTETDTSTEH